MAKKRLTALQKHLSEAGVKGGNALFKKIGSKGMTALVRRRWDKKRLSTPSAK